MISILGINISFEFPFVRKAIPLTSAQNGHPICFKSDSKPTAWYLVCASSGQEFELDPIYLEYVNGSTYYNASINLFEYIQTNLGYTLYSNNYYYKFEIDGNTYYSNAFKIETINAATPPSELADWNNDWSNDFNI